MIKPPSHRLVPTKVAALAVGVSEATIRKWVSRGKITRYGAPADMPEHAQRDPGHFPRGWRAGAPGVTI
jgi:hypothetical protein